MKEWQFACVLVHVGILGILLRSQSLSISEMSFIFEQCDVNETEWNASVFRAFDGSSSYVFRLLWSCESNGRVKYVFLPTTYSFVCARNEVWFGRIKVHWRNRRFRKRHGFGNSTTRGIVAKPNNIASAPSVCAVIKINIQSHRALANQPPGKSRYLTFVKRKF